MKKEFFIILLSLIVFALFYLIYEYYFINSAEAPMLPAQTGNAMPETNQAGPVSQSTATAPKYPGSFRGPTGMPFIQGPTEQPPGQ
ncbi:MAG: hypothetical protein HYW71_02095 [Candidatus Niyogibacteria bacterium]|nr:hypothetical protein [Candidatus Niyogibacteria bacterium]